MPKDLGQTTQEEKTRSIDNFTVTARLSGDILDVHPVIEYSDPDTGEVTRVESIDGGRFSQDEIEAAWADIEELSAIDYSTLRIGLSKLMHALLDTRG